MVTKAIYLVVELPGRPAEGFSVVGWGEGTPEEIDDSEWLTTFYGSESRDTTGGLLFPQATEFSKCYSASLCCSGRLFRHCPSFASLDQFSSW